jgi:hypothetical protein
MTLVNMPHRYKLSVGCLYKVVLNCSMSMYIHFYAQESVQKRNEIVNIL